MNIPAPVESVRTVSSPARRSGSSTPATLLVALAGSVVGGCSVGPSYQPPEVKTNDAWIAGVPVAPTVANARWWTTFGDPVLDKLIERACAQNFTLKAAGLRVIEARAIRGVAAGQFFPQSQSVGGNLNNRQNSINTPAAMGDRAYPDAELKLQAAWELDFWGKFRRSIEAADASLQAAVGDYDSVMVSLIGDVATNYVLIRSLQERVALAESNVRLQQDTLELTNLRFKAGKVGELDVATARATLANTRAQVPELRASLRQAALALSVLLGQQPGTLEDLITTSQPKVPDAPASIATGVPADLLRRRPDLRAAERAIAAATARVGVATADLYPSISISGNTGFAAASLDNSRRSKINNIFDANSFTGFIGLNVNWPILNYGRIENNIRAADARVEQALAAYNAAVITAAAEVEQNLYLLLQRQQQAVDLTESVDAARRSVELAQIQYKNGAADFIRLNDAQATLFSRQDTLVATKANATIAAINAYRALGGGWEIRSTAEFVDAATVERMRARTNWGDILNADYANGSDQGFARPATPTGENAQPSTPPTAPAASHSPAAPKSN